LVQEVHAGRLIDMPRYAFTSEKLDIEHLRRLGSQIPQGYRIESMDLDLAQQLAGERSEFASDHMLNFDSPEDFIERGFGFCILDGDEIVSVATTFAICDKGIEIQINTREEHQGKRLATVVAAHLLVYSLERNLDPNWDAANESSVGLAKKLGYTPQGTYSIVLVVGSRALAVLVRFGLKVKAFFERS
jgi:RimJ/RimL family protein N-acetyltransferase